MIASTRYLNVIFLDIDGVLNGYNFWNLLGWDIISELRNFFNEYTMDKEW